MADAAAAAASGPEGDLDEEVDFNDSHAAKKNRGGRPQHPVRKYFENKTKSTGTDKHPSGDCMYCYKTFTRAKPDHLVKHFVDGKCKGAPPEVREELLKLTAEGAPTAVLPSTALTSTAAPTSSGNSSATSGSKRSSSMTDHYGSSKPVTDEEARMLDHLLLRAMVDCGISFRLLSNPFFLDWLDRATSQRYTAAGQ